MFKNPIVLTIITCGVFFFLATATSPPPEDFPPFAQINGTVEVVDSNLIIVNNDTLDIVNAFMTLEKPTGDSLDGSPITVSYFAEDFNLSVGATDTFPMSTFEQGGIFPYPIDTFPHRFSLEFQNMENSGFFEVFF